MSLGLRLYGTVVLAGVLFVLTVVVVFSTVKNQQVRQLRDVAESLGAAELSRCDDDPAAFLGRMGVARVWAYDELGRPANPAAPLLPLRPDEIPSSGNWIGGTPGRGSWGKIGVSAREGAACAVLAAFMPEAQLSSWVRRTLMLSMVFALFVALAVAMGVVRPLVRSAHALDQAAVTLGGKGYRAPSDLHSPELQRIGSALTSAHHRLRAETRSLAERNRDLENHLAALAHDLRTPLASLQLSLEALEHDPTAGRDAMVEVAYLEALAENLHQGMRLQAGPGVTESFDLVDVARRVVSRFSILGRARNLEVIAALPEQPLIIEGDAALVERALANLVHNTLVHGSSGMSTAVALNRSEVGFQLTVVGGEGYFSDAELAALHTRRLGERGVARSRSEGGLGVAVVNHVAVLHGWEVRYAAADPTGLWVTLSGTNS